MRIVFMNAPILTSPGTYKYESTSLENAKEMVQQEKDSKILSAVGHKATADILTELFGFEIPMNRINYKQDNKDIVIVFKLNGRPEEGKILKRAEIEKIGYSFYILTKD